MLFRSRINRLPLKDEPTSRQPCGNRLSCFANIDELKAKLIQTIEDIANKNRFDINMLTPSLVNLYLIVLLLAYL